MTDTLARLAAALEGRYRIERELGQGGMAGQRLYMVSGSEAPSTFIAVHHFFDRLAFENRRRP